MTDVRTAGELKAELTVRFTPASSGAGTWSGTFRLVNALGTWSGTGRGAAVRGADDLAGAVDLYGKAIYRGSGAYAGLDFTQLLAGEDTPTTFSGWISGPPPTEPWARFAASR